MTPLFIGNLRLPEIIIIALVILLLFGGKKIPELMRSLGRGVHAFKDGLNDTKREEPESPETKEEKEE
ncbi:MAG: twin-arginine translocase TatA/TatE family subunit [Bacteroidaceae bacterium]|nr:twin-arginine translocase TatA/TatE family subunit [Bacteroidaceae bacterium]